MRLALGAKGRVADTAGGRARQKLSKYTAMLGPEPLVAHQVGTDSVGGAFCQGSGHVPAATLCRGCPRPVPAIPAPFLGPAGRAPMSAPNHRGCIASLGEEGETEAQDGGGTAESS